MSFQIQRKKKLCCIDYITETEGYLMNKFVKLNESGNTFFSAVTNKRNKLEIILHNTITEVDFEIGRKFELIGDIQITGFICITHIAYLIFCT